MTSSSPVCGKKVGDAGEDGAGEDGDCGNGDVDDDVDAESVADAADAVAACAFALRPPTPSPPPLNSFAREVDAEEPCIGGGGRGDASPGTIVCCAEFESVIDGDGGKGSDAFPAPTPSPPPGKRSRAASVASSSSTAGDPIAGVSALRALAFDADVDAATEALTPALTAEEDPAVSSVEAVVTFAAKGAVMSIFGLGAQPWPASVPLPPPSTPPCLRSGQVGAAVALAPLAPPPPAPPNKTPIEPPWPPV